MLAPKVAKPPTNPVTLRANMHESQRSNGIVQRRIGNQAMLRQVTLRSGQQPEATARPKLTIGPIDDPLDDEADRVAHQVVRMPDTTHAAGTSVGEGSEYRHGE